MGDETSDAKDALSLRSGSTPQADMSLLSITDGENERGVPLVKFIDDVEAFTNTFSPPASAELLIGAYSELHQKFKTFEISLNQKSEHGDGDCPRVSAFTFLTFSFCLSNAFTRIELPSENSRSREIPFASENT